jgi:O-antigen ligase
MVASLARLFPYLLLVPAALPLIFVDGLLYPYLTPKTLLFRADFILAFATFIVLALSGRAFFYSRLREPLLWLPAAFLAWAYITSLFGIDFYHSFWSLFDRGEGLLTLTGIVGFFYLTLLFADERFVEKLMKIVAVIASIVAFFALLQWVQDILGVPLPLVPDSPGRIGSTLGNAAYLASYLGIAFFVTLAIAPRVAAKWRTRAYVGAAMQLCAIVVSATRGALLALLIVGFLALVYYAWKGQGAVRRRAQLGLVGLLILSGLFFVFRAQLAHVPFEPVQRIASISLADATVESRLFLSRTIGAEALSSSLLGVGAEHIEVLFNRVYDPTGIIEQWFDRSHNAYLDYFVQYGVPGLFLMLGILATFAWKSFELARDRDVNTSHLGLLFLALIVVYALQNVFLFDVMTSLWLVFALLAALCIGGKEKSYALSLPRLPGFVPFVIGALLIALVVPVSFIPLYANLLLGGGYLYHLADVDRAVTAMEKGYALDTYADLEYGYQLYEMYTERQMVQLDAMERLRAYRFAEKVLSQNYENYPYDARTATYYAHILDVPPPEVPRDDTKLRAVVEHAIELSPKRIQPWYLLTNIPIRAGDALPPGSAEKNQYYTDAVEILAEYAALVPRFAEPRFVIATLYLTMGDRAQAAEWAEQGLAVYEPDENTARRASRYYVTVEDWQNARRFLADVVESEPFDYPVKYDLAKAEFLAGNPDRALELVAELQVEAPGLVETDPDFLAALGL